MKIPEFDNAGMVLGENGIVAFDVEMIADTDDNKAANGDNGNAAKNAQRKGDDSFDDSRDSLVFFAHIGKKGTSSLKPLESCAFRLSLMDQLG